MTAPKLKASGVSKKPQLPAVLAYPQLLTLEPPFGLYNKLCYIIKAYPTTGFALLIWRQPNSDNIAVVAGDWFGNSLDISKPTSPLIKSITNFIEGHLTKIINFITAIKVQQIQLFFAVDAAGPYLVDAQLSLNKFASPGMIKELFAKLMRVQEVLKVELMDDRVVRCVTDGVSSYGEDLIVKPAIFKMYNKPGTNDFVPHYVQVKR